MAINGAMEAGMNQNYDIIISKGVIDGVTSITFAAAMGMGVVCSVLPLLVYQGGLTLIFGLVGQGIPPETITEMSAVGGTIIVGWPDLGGNGRFLRLLAKIYKTISLFHRFLVHILSQLLNNIF